MSKPENNQPENPGKKINSDLEKFKPILGIIGLITGLLSFLQKQSILAISIVLVTLIFYYRSHLVQVWKNRKAYLQTGKTLLSTQTKRTRKLVSSNKKNIIKIGIPVIIIIMASVGGFLFYQKGNFSKIDTAIEKAIAQAELSELSKIRQQLKDYLLINSEDNGKYAIASAIFRLGAVSYQIDELDSLELYKFAELSSAIHQRFSVPDWIGKETKQKIINHCKKQDFSLPNTSGGILLCGNKETLNDILPVLRPGLESMDFSASNKLISFPIKLPFIQDDWAIYHALMSVTESQYLFWTIGNEKLKIRGTSLEIEKFLNKPSPNLEINIDDLHTFNSRMVNYHNKENILTNAYHSFKENRLLDSYLKLNTTAGLPNNDPFGPSFHLFEGILSLLTDDTGLLRKSNDAIQKYANQNDFSYCSLMLQMGMMAKGMSDINGSYRQYLNQYIYSNNTILSYTQLEIVRALTELLELVGEKNTLMDLSNFQTNTQFSISNISKVNKSPNSDSLNNSSFFVNSDTNPASFEKIKNKFIELERYDLALIPTTNLLKLTKSPDQSTVLSNQIMDYLGQNSFLTGQVFIQLFPDIIQTHQSALTPSQWEKMAEFFLTEIAKVIDTRQNLSLSDTYRFLSGLTKLCHQVYEREIAEKKLEELLKKVKINLKGSFEDVFYFVIANLKNFNLFNNPEETFQTFNHFLDVLDLNTQSDSLTSEQHLFYASLNQFLAIRNLINEGNAEDGIVRITTALRHLNKKNETPDNAENFNILRIVAGIQGWLFSDFINDSNNANIFRDLAFRYVEEMLSEGEEPLSDIALEIYKDLAVHYKEMGEVLIKRYVNKEINNIQMYRDLIRLTRRYPWDINENMPAGGYYFHGINLLLSDGFVALGLNKGILKKDDPVFSQLYRFMDSFTDLIREKYSLNRGDLTYVLLDFAKEFQRKFAEIATLDRKYIQESKRNEYLGKMLFPYIEQIADIIYQKTDTIENLEERLLIQDAPIAELTEAAILWQARELSAEFKKLDLNSDNFFDSFWPLWESLANALNRQIKYLNPKSPPDLQAFLYQERAVLKMLLSENDLAGEDLRKLLVLFPEYSKEFSLLLAINYGHGKNYEAMTEVLNNIQNKEENDEIRANNRAFDPVLAMAYLGNKELEKSLNAINRFLEYCKTEKTPYTEFKTENKFTIHSTIINELYYNFGLSMSTVSLIKENPSDQLEFSMGWSGRKDIPESEKFEKEIDGSLLTNDLIVWNCHLYQLFLKTFMGQKLDGEEVEEAVLFLKKHPNVYSVENLKLFAWVMTYLDMKGYHEVVENFISVPKKIINSSGASVSMGRSYEAESFRRVWGGDSYQDPSELINLIAELDEYAPKMLSYFPNITELEKIMPRCIRLTFEHDFIKPNSIDAKLSRQKSSFVSSDQMENYVLNKMLQRLDKIPSKRLKGQAKAMLASNPEQNIRKEYLNTYYRYSSPEIDEIKTVLKALISVGEPNKALAIIEKHGGQETTSFLNLLPARKWSVKGIDLMKELLMEKWDLENPQKVYELARSIEQIQDVEYISGHFPELADMLLFFYWQSGALNEVSRLSEQVYNSEQCDDHLKNRCGALSIAANLLIEKQSGKVTEKRFNELKESTKFIRLYNLGDFDQAFIYDLRRMKYSNANVNKLAEISEKELKNVLTKKCSKSSLIIAEGMLHKGKESEAWLVLSKMRQFLKQRDQLHLHIEDFAQLTRDVSSDRNQKITILEEYLDVLEKEETKIESPNLSVMKELMYVYYNNNEAKKFHELFVKYTQKTEHETPYKNPDYLFMTALNFSIDKNESLADSALLYLQKSYLSEIKQERLKWTPRIFIRSNCVNIIHDISKRHSKIEEGLALLNEIFKLENESELRLKILNAVKSLNEKLSGKKGLSQFASNVYELAKLEDEDEIKIWAIEKIINENVSSISKTQQIINAYSEDALDMGHWGLLHWLYNRKANIYLMKNDYTRAKNALYSLHDIASDNFSPEKNPNQFLDIHLLEFRLSMMKGPDDKRRALESLEAALSTFGEINNEQDAIAYSQEVLSIYSLFYDPYTAMSYGNDFIEKIKTFLLKQARTVSYNARPYAAIELLWLSSVLIPNDETLDNLEVAQKLAELHNSSRILEITNALIDMYIFYAKDPMRAKVLARLSRKKYTNHKYDFSRKLRQLEKAIPDKEIQQMIEKADQAMAVGQFDESLDLYQKILVKQPDRTHCYEQIGNIYKNKNDYKNALVYFEKARKSEPENVNHSLNIANIHFALKDYSTTVQEIFEAARKDSAYLPNAIDRDFKIIVEECVKNDTVEAAIMAAKSAIKLSPNSPITHHYLGFSHYNNQQYEESIKSFSKAVNLNPKYIYAHQFLGFAHSALENNETALQSFNRVLEIDSTFYQAWFEGGTLFLKEKNYDKAFEYFLNARKHGYNNLNEAVLKKLNDTMTELNQNPSSVDWNKIAEKLIAASYSQKQSWILKINVDWIWDSKKYNQYGYSLKWNPQSIAWMKLGILSEDISESAALLCYENAIQSDSRNGLSYLMRGWIERNNEQYSKSISSFANGLKTETENAFFWTLKGHSESHLNQYKNAANSYSKALLTDSLNSMLYYHRGSCYAQTENYSNSKKDFEKLEEITKESWKKSPENLQNIQSLCYVYLLNQKFRKAVLLSENALNKFPSDHFLAAYLAFGYWFTGEYDESKEVLTRIKDKTLNNQPFPDWGNSTLDNLKKFSFAQSIHLSKEAGKLEKLLNELGKK